MITLDNVSKWYGSHQVLADCSAVVSKGEVVVVCGPSGSGKSTLVKTINGLEPFQKGSITVDGARLGDPSVKLAQLRARVGMVFQHFELFPHLSVLENLTLAQTKVLRRERDEACDIGLRLLDRVGLKAHACKFPGQLSGGQQQRVAIARASTEAAPAPNACRKRTAISMSIEPATKQPTLASVKSVMPPSSTGRRP
ncbi:amino acid ABC transporter ATP-binding protein [Burkholderia pseudomallei]|nr:amino acid ABC transporter ATP-binding protein [Burkholderia pseudomallei]